MIGVNYTSPSNAISTIFRKKKNPGANDHNSSACKYFIAVKWVSFFWLAYV